MPFRPIDLAFKLFFLYSLPFSRPPSHRFPLFNHSQFTTLENTPPEYLLLGSGARQAFSADTFCLGLSFLHLLTGLEPYEELLRDVRCPEYLLRRLRGIWEHPEADAEVNPYAVICEVIHSLETGDADEDDLSNPQRVLYDTFYRYFVLFGCPAEASEASEPAVGAGAGGAVETTAGVSILWGSSNPVWNAVRDSLFSQPQPKEKRQKGRRKQLDGDPDLSAKRACRMQFERDFGAWSVQSGAHEIMHG